jgi:hypothetical protein
MTRTHIALLIGLCFIATGCRQGTHQVVSEVDLPVYKEEDTLSATQQRLAAMPPYVRERLGDPFLKRLFENGQEPNIQFSDDLEGMPRFPEQSIPISYRSPYDDTRLIMRVSAPDGDASSLVLVLGEASETVRTKDRWVVHAPSRPLLNYQLIAERELWGMVEDLYHLYPETRALPLILVGEGRSAERTLSLANDYRSKVHGVAYNGGRFRPQRPNLDEIPIAHFGHEGEGVTWIQYLQERGNGRATQVETLESAIKFVEGNKAALLEKVNFMDNLHAQVTPWLSVTSRKDELEPVTLSAQLKQGTVTVSAVNATGLRVNPTLVPRSIQTIRLNDESAVALKGKGTVQIGEEAIPQDWRHKVDTPNSFMDFYRTDPLVVVYQDRDVLATYAQLAKGFAERLATLQFHGLPSNMGVSLPVLPLSSYRPDDFPRHRLILIGRHRATTAFLESNEGYFPIQSRGSTVSCNGRKISLESDQYKESCFGLIYPPENKPSVSLCLLLTSADEVGMQTLIDHYGSAMALYSPYDLILWKRRADDFQIALRRTFDSYWGYSPQSTLTIDVPPQPAQAWQTLLEDLVIGDSNMERVILGPLIDQGMDAPSRITYHTLKRYVPERHFVRVTVYGSSGVDVANQLLHNTPNRSTFGLEDQLGDEGQFSRKSLRSQKVELLVERSVVNVLTEEERQLVEIEPLPYSLHEMLQKKIDTQQREFARDLLRLGNLVIQ